MIRERPYSSAIFFWKDDLFGTFGKWKYDFSCSVVCTKEFLPFSSLDDKNLILTVQGEKKKFTNVAEKRISNKTKLPDQTNLIKRCEDNNITK